jgi:hypothetical protein
MITRREQNGRTVQLGQSALLALVESDPVAALKVLETLP